MDVGLIAVCRRADVSSVLVALKDDGANMVYVEARVSKGFLGMAL